jgi:hypothetical protein
MQFKEELHHLKKLMIQRLFILLILFISTNSYGQQYYSADIIKKADSIMQATVGERIFKQYLHYDSSSYYEFKSFSGKTQWKTLTAFKETKGKFKNISVRYLFCLNKYDIYCLSTSIEFDSSLNQKGTIATYFIPEYVLNNTECNFITDTAALNIAKSKFTRQGIKLITAGLTYDHNRKLYIWTVDNTLTKKIDSFGKNYGEIQIVEIDALTGKVLNFWPDAIFGPVR